MPVGMSTNNASTNGLLSRSPRLPTSKASCCLKGRKKQMPTSRVECLVAFTRLRRKQILAPALRPIARLWNDDCYQVDLTTPHDPVSTILLVDDDAKFLRPLQILLEGEGYRVLTALNGKAAASLTEEECPDLIVTYWMMPGVDGVALCRWLKADSVTASIPVVMLSAAQPPRAAERLWDVFLRKPTPIARLIVVISNLLEARWSVRSRQPHAR